MRKIIEKFRREQNQMAMGLLGDEGSTDCKPTSEKGKDMETEDCATCAVARMMDSSEVSSIKGTTNQPFAKPSEGRAFFSGCSSWA